MTIDLSTEQWKRLSHIIENPFRNGCDKIVIKYAFYDKYEIDYWKVKIRTYDDQGKKHNYYIVQDGNMVKK